MNPCNPDLPSTWVRFRSSACDNCRAACCRLPVEVSMSDLIRLGVVSADEAEGSHKKLARRLMKEGMIAQYRARTGLFTLSQRQNGDCYFLDGQQRCTVYETRPSVCRDFPERVGPRIGYCPNQPK